MLSAIFILIYHQGHFKTPILKGFILIKIKIRSGMTLNTTNLFVALYVLLSIVCHSFKITNELIKNALYVRSTCSELRKNINLKVLLNYILFYINTIHIFNVATNIM